MPFSAFRMADAVEVLLIAIAIYGILRFIRSTRGVGVLRGLFAFVIGLAVLIGVLDRFLPGGLDVIRYLLGVVTPFFALIVVILFQQELRQGIGRIGQLPFFRRFSKEEKTATTLDQVVQAVRRMAGQRIGALIAFERQVSLAPWCEGAVQVDLPVTALLLETLFYPGSPLHDGAVVIRGDRIVAASAIMPLSSNPDLTRRLGTRHRAAIGITEETDAVAVVVSEETGSIGLAVGGRLERGIAAEELAERLQDLLIAKPSRAAAEAAAEPQEATP